MLYSSIASLVWVQEIAEDEVWVWESRRKSVEEWRMKNEEKKMLLNIECVCVWERDPTWDGFVAQWDREKRERVTRIGCERGRGEIEDAMLVGFIL